MATMEMNSGVGTMFKKDFSNIDRNEISFRHSDRKVCLLYLFTACYAYEICIYVVRKNEKLAKSNIPLFVFLNA